MIHNQSLPLFNLKAVITETGIKADTLRAWERRYGIPSPQRTPSGHRLYSQDDIDMLHWLVARQAEGLSISRATELWLNLQNERSAGEPSSPRQPVSASPFTIPSVELQPEVGAHADTLRDLRATWVNACLRFNEVEAEQTLAHAFALFTPEMVCLEVLQKGLATIGEGWYRGSVTVQQEHFASALALRRLEAMLVATPAPSRPGRILIGCPPEEEHTFVPLLLSLLLRRRGWETIYLGANVPLVSLEATVAATHPQLVVLTAQQLATVRGLLEMAEVLLHQHVPLAYGGLIFNRVRSLQESIPGHFLGDRIDAGVAKIEEIMLLPRVLRAQRPTEHAYRTALSDYLRAQPEIEAAVAQRVHAHALSPRLLAAANFHFGRNVEAALALGNMDYAGVDLEWIDGLLINHVGMLPDRVRDYLHTYLDASRAVLAGRAALFTDWLVRLLASTPLQPWSQPAAQPSANNHASATPSLQRYEPR